MANPQKENGYTAIANELIDFIIGFRIPGEVRQVFDAILRKTYGYNKKEDSIANSQIVELTKMKKQNVSRSLMRLIENNLVIKIDDRTGKGNILKINKDYNQWIPFVIKEDDKKKRKKASSKRIKKSSKRMTSVIKNDVNLSSEVMDTKDRTILKDNIQKTRENTPAKNARQFFKGVNDLVNNIQSMEAVATKIFLQQIEKQYPEAPKRLIWHEIRKFERYWTEKNKLGTKELWEQRETFEVDRRLVTWFGKVKEFQQKNNKVDFTKQDKEIIL